MYIKNTYHGGYSRHGSCRASPPIRGPRHCQRSPSKGRSYGPHKEATASNNASLVSSAWCKATKHPILWPALDADIWKTYCGRRRSMRQFYLFLRRPQFACLKKLVPPDIYRTLHRNVFDGIAKICPFLEDLDLSGCNSIRHLLLIPFKEELPRLPALFPNLKSLRGEHEHGKRVFLALQASFSKVPRGG